MNHNKRELPLHVYQQRAKITSNPELDFITFGHSSLKGDSGQSALPFWDGQAVAPVPASPLMGIGLYWRSIFQSSGFVAPMVLPYDRQKFIYSLDIEDLREMIDDHDKKISVWLNYEK